jgi:hypothetical protein
MFATKVFFGLSLILLASYVIEDVGKCIGEANKLQCIVVYVLRLIGNLDLLPRTNCRQCITITEKLWKITMEITLDLVVNITICLFLFLIQIINRK